MNSSPLQAEKGAARAMATATATRRLAAILAADVVGYSRLMGADEEGTHERVKAHLREVVDPKISEHHGRIVKTTGDGVLAEFASVVDAVRSAAEIQHAMIGRDRDLPEERRLRFRICDRRQRRHLRRRRQHRGAAGGVGRTERHLRLRHGARPHRRPASLRLRGYRRAECQKHRTTCSGLCFATQCWFRPAYIICAGPPAAPPECSPYCNSD